MNISINIISPVIYIFFVKLVMLLPPIPNSNLMKLFRKCHNLGLSFLSFAMLIGICYGNYKSNKFSDLDSLLCKPYVDNISYYSGLAFLYSKYWEWLDTLFLQLSKKKISMLHYTHHMTTAFTMYFNISEYLSPHIFVFIFLNCMVHTLMYWYYAYPKGLLYKFRKLITKLQIIQHIICLLTIIYTYNLKNCEQNKYGNQIGFMAYLMYLVYFVLFYISTYLKKKD